MLPSALVRSPNEFTYRPSLCFLSGVFTIACICSSSEDFFLVDQSYSFLRGDVGNTRSPIFIRSLSPKVLRQQTRSDRMFLVALGSVLVSPYLLGAEPLQAHQTSYPILIALHSPGSSAPGISRGCHMSRYSLQTPP